MTIVTISGAKKVRVERTSALSNSITLKITAGSGDVEFNLFGLPEEERLLLMRALSDAESYVRTLTGLVPMGEWLVERDVHAGMGLRSDD